MPDTPRPRIFDSHLHIVDPRFPLVPNQGYLPDPFTVDDYRERTRGFDVAGGAVVSGSFQAFDQAYLRAALAELGPAFVGVTQVPGSIADAEILDLHAAGVRAVRFNLLRGGSAGVEDIETLARRVHEVAGWHVEIYTPARELRDLERLLVGLPRVSIDHLGLTREGFDVLLRLVDRGVRVKATGFGRVDFDVSEALRAIATADPAALLFGTDLPSTRVERPFLDTDVDLVLEALGDDLGRRSLFDNARAWYGRQDSPPSPA
jgi:predicted TIM-barrel fold metal-dependent hydrolase